MHLEQELPVFKLFGDGENKDCIIDLNAWPFNIPFDKVGVDSATAAITGPVGDNPCDVEIVNNGVVKLKFAGPIAVGVYANVKLTCLLAL